MSQNQTENLWISRLRVLSICVSFTLLFFVSNREFSHQTKTHLSEETPLYVEISKQPSTKTKIQTLDNFDKIQAELEWQELADLKLSRDEKKLLGSLTQDEFQDVRPFAILSDISAIKEILKRKPQTFKRMVYRSPQFQLGSGYDTVKYEIALSDGSKSYIFAYRQKTAAEQISVGQHEDLRPIFTLIALENADAKLEVYFFENGQLKSVDQRDPQDALLDIEDWIEKSTPFVAWN